MCCSVVKIKRNFSFEYFSNHFLRKLFSNSIFIYNICRSKKWVINCQRKDLLQKSSEYLHRNCRMCTVHFEQSQFMNTNKNSLIKSAVPTVFAINNRPKPKTYSNKKISIKGKNIVRTVFSFII